MSYLRLLTYLAFLAVLGTLRGPVALAGNPEAHASASPPAAGHPVGANSDPGGQYTTGYRCNTVGSFNDQGEKESQGVAISISVPIPKTGQGIQIAKTGIENSASNVTSRNIVASFCVPETDAKDKRLIEEDSEGVPRAAMDGKIVCHAEISHRWTVTADAYLEFVGNGFTKLDHNETRWSTTHDFQVLNIGKGTSFHDIVGKCQSHAMWGDMQRDAAAAKGYPYFLMRQFGHNVQCLHDEDCPQPIINPYAALGYVDSRKVARCVRYTSKDTNKLVSLACLNLSKENQPCEANWFDERGSCDFGLKCKLITIFGSWDPEEAVIRKCKKDEPKPFVVNHTSNWNLPYTGMTLKNSGLQDTTWKGN